MRLVVKKRLDGQTYLCETGEKTIKLRSIDELAVGDTLEAELVELKDPFHGSVFAVKEIKVRGTDEKLKAMYTLTQIPGIGNITAKKIVDALGEDCLKKILNDPSQLYGIKGVRLDQKKSIENHVRLLSAAETISKLVPHLPFREVATLAKIAVQVEVDDKISEDPCYLTIYGDNINPRRLVQEPTPLFEPALVVYELQKAAASDKISGLSFEELAKRTKLDGKKVESACETLAKMNVVLVRDKIASLSKVAESYGRLILFTRRNMRLGRQNHEQIIRDVKSYLDSANEKLNDMQMVAVTKALTQNLCVITGGPGTGKSVTIEAIYRAGRALGFNVVVLAPTGKAAQRLRSVNARTIHAALGWDGLRSTRRLEADIVVVDEASMVDAVVLGQLIASMDRASLVLVGDANQLPPVGYGAPFHSMIELRKGGLSVVELSESYRNNEEIAKLARHVLNENVSEFVETLRNGVNVRAIQRDSREELLDLIRSKYEQAFKMKGLKELYDSLMILSPYKRENRSELSTTILNDALGEALGFAERLGKDVKVVQLINDYDKRVMNGETGIVSWKTDLELEVDFPQGPALYSDLEAEGCLDRAFALTVHKAQGSEAETVWLILTPSSYGIMSKQMLYTAITRAKSKFALFGLEDALSLQNLHAIFGKSVKYVDDGFVKEVMC